MNEWQAFTEEVIDALLEDGSNEEAMHTIEHHFASEDFDVLEAAAVAAFKLGFDVTDAEEFETEDGIKVLAFDIIIESPLEEESIMGDITKMLELAKRCKVEYDGWGTFFED
ncbi:MAG: regulator of RNase E activity RraB [Alteromonadaceae bacterium]|jgi:regulator of RNase E activity RraB